MEIFCRTQACAKNWQDAIRVNATDLLDNHCITEDYVDGIIANTNEWGPYYILKGGVAMPHARPEQGALKNAFSFTTLQSPVDFGTDAARDIRLLIGMSASDPDSHIENIQKLSRFLEDDEKLEQVIQAPSEEVMEATLREAGFQV